MQDRLWRLFAWRRTMAANLADYLERRGYDVRTVAEEWMLETVFCVGRH